MKLSLTSELTVSRALVRGGRFSFVMPWSALRGRQFAGFRSGRYSLDQQAGRWAVRSRRSKNEKEPWKTLPAHDGNIERQFVLGLHIGETILPYRTLEPLLAVIPWDGRRLLNSSDERLASFPGLADWWGRAEQAWNTHRSSERLSLTERLDYQRGLSQQFPLSAYRVVYSASGMYLAAAIVKEPAIIEHKLYWGAASSVEEARYLEAVLNSDALTLRVRPLQARGEHNPRDFDKYVWQLPIPMYDAENPRHARLAELAKQAEKIAATVVLPPGKRFEALRRLIRQAVEEANTGREIEEEVKALLSEGC